MKRSGFTLVEVIVASMIGTFVALVAVGMLKVVSDGAERVADGAAANAEVRFAAKTIAADLTNLYRDDESGKAQFIGISDRDSDSGAARMVMHVVGRTKARAGQPEGDVYEVEYFVLTEEDQSVLCRRLWPNPDEDAQPGGVVTMIAEGIDVFQVGYFDGEQWQIEWPETMQSVPEMVQVDISASLSGGTDMVSESFIVNFTTAAGSENAARNRGGRGQGQGQRRGGGDTGANEEERGPREN